MIKELIARKYGIKLNVTSVGRLLKKLGLSVILVDILSAKSNIILLS
jgi:hypothetical protein